mgnify:CR=1 FL=1
MARRRRRIKDYADRTVRLSRMNAWVTSANIRKWLVKNVESGKCYKSLTLSLPVTKTLQFMYTTATMRAARLGQSI